MLIKISKGRLIDPGFCDEVKDLYILDGKIIGFDELAADVVIDREIDAENMWVVPGLIDLHVHLREPGHEYKETIASGSEAAACGGFTSVCCMPNTRPVNDSAQITKFILDEAKKAGFARVLPVSAVSSGLSGGGLVEFHEQIEAGSVAFTDDGLPVGNSQLMRRALEYAKGFDSLIMSHSEEISLVAGGAMNEGPYATKMGIPGIPNAAESIMVMRDIALCELTGSRLHLCHVSTRESVRAIREAKSRGVRVTAETAPHYFTLTDEAVGMYNTHAKMNPPLRSAEDREAICEGLADGTLDAIATDHAPHSDLEKDLEFNRAANGITGLETSLPLSLALVEKGVLTVQQLLMVMSKNPAEILGLDHGLAPGMIADVTVIDPEKIITFDSKKSKSKSRNTPFEGWELKGNAAYTIVDGKIVYAADWIVA